MVNNFHQLFYQDAYQKEFTARVTAVREDEQGDWVCLSETCFYPLGGGQPGDRGYLSLLSSSQEEGQEFTVRVTDTRWQENKIWQRVDRLLPVGCQVHGRIDFVRRYDLMQQHSGEHIFSGLVQQHYGYTNVGFHIGETEMTFDFDGKLTARQIAELETKANQAIIKNIPIEIRYLTHEQQKGISYRSKLDLKDDVRLVTIAGYDRCACAGTHVRSTCEIGLLKIIRQENYKKGVRLTALCGSRALRYYQELNALTAELGTLLSVTPQNLLEAFRREREHTAFLKAMIDKKNRQWVDLFTETIPKGQGHTLIIDMDFAKTEWKYICKKIVQKNKGIASILTANEGKYTLYMYSEKINLQNYCLYLQEQLQFKGGGNEDVLQGMVNGKREEIEKKLQRIP